MKTKLALLITIILASLSLNAKDVKKNKKEEVTFNVSMTCENCKKRIEKSVAFEKGVSDMQVNLPAKTVMLQYNPNKTDVEKLQTAIEKLGYTVTVDEPDEK